MTWIAGITTLLVAFALTAISGKFLIPFLRKLKFGQTIKEIGPTWHEKKEWGCLPWVVLCSLLAVLSL